MKWIANILLIFCGLLITGCSVKERTEDARATLMEQYKKIPEWNKLPKKQLSWSRAIAMIENNHEMRRARQNIKEAEIYLRRVYTQFIPMVDIGYYYNTALIKGDSSSPSEGQFDVNVIFSIPALTRLPVDHYTRSLALFKAQKDYELKRREQIAKLWQFFREYDIEQKKAQTNDITTRARFADKRLIQKERELQIRARTQNLAHLLNDYSARWQPVADTLPQVQWKNYRQKAKVSDELTQIMMALNLEVARLQKLGIALRYFPDIQLNFFSPSLFSSSGGTTEGFFSGNQDVRLNLNSYLQLDTRLEIWGDWLIAKENYKLVQEEITRQMHEYRNKMELLLDSWKTYDEWKQCTRDYLNFRNQQGAYDSESLKTLYDEDIAFQLEMFEQEQKNIERECALIQEYGLP